MKIEEAVLAALDPATPEPLKSQATYECDVMRKSADGWKMALQLLSTKSDAIKFFCCQVLEESLFHKTKIRRELWEWIVTQYSLSDPVFIRNKLALLVILAFKNEFKEWPEFFDQLLNFDMMTDLRRIDLLLRACVILDEEVTKNDHTMTEIKDVMRADAVQKLTSCWISILNLRQDDLSGVCLMLFGKFSSWIDINLVIQNQFIGMLFDSLANSRLRVTALETIVDIIGKGMSGQDKLALIQGFGLPMLILKFELNKDLQFDLAVAKLVNAMFLEITIALENVQVLDQFLFGAFDLLDPIFPILLQLLSREEEEFHNIFTSLSVHFAFLKKLKKTSFYGSLKHMKEKMESLLRVVVLKMRYPPDFDPNAFTESSHEEAQFNHFRRELKSHFDSIAILEQDMFIEAVSSAVCSTFQNFSFSNTGISWADVELSIFLVFILHESAQGPCVYVQSGSNSGEKTGIGKMLSLLISSNISSYPHPAVSPIFFETVARYASFFDEFPENLPSILHCFVDKRGLHNPDKFIRNRVQYLFLRFIKSLKVKLSQYVTELLSALQDCLVVEAPLDEKEHRPASASSSSSHSKPDSMSSVFESQLCLFEAVGRLISYEPDTLKQCESLSFVLTPLISQIQVIFNRQQQHIDILHIHHLIVAIGGLAKGFPDFDASEKSIPAWHPLFRDALKFIIQILEKLQSQSLICEAVRYSLQRLVGCMGSDIMIDVLPIVKAGVLTGGSSGSSKDLIDFLSFLGVLMFKFKMDFYPIINEMIIPLHERSLHLINKDRLGTDDLIESVEVKRAYISFLGAILNSDLEMALTSELNLRLLSSALDLLLRSLLDFSDSACQKIVCAVLVKMIAMWGDDPETSLAGGKGSKKGSASQMSIKRRLLPGFDEFIFSSIIPILFQVPFEKKTFNLNDGQVLAFLGELSCLHRTIYVAQGSKYVNYLTTVAFPSYHIPSDSASAFITALSTIESKQFKKFLQDFIKAHQKQ